MKKKLYTILTITILVCLILVSCARSPGGDNEMAKAGDFEGTLSISGAFALYPMMTRWAEEFSKANPGVDFDISAGGAGKGMADALSGAVDIGMVSREISPDEENKGAFAVPVTKDAVFVTISDQNPVLDELLAKGISRELFKKVFITGEITTWGELAGKPEITDEIHVYTRSDACGAAETWAKYLGGAQEDLLGIAVFGDPGLLDAVIKDPLGIGFNNLNYAYSSEGSPVTGVAIVPIDQDENGSASSDELLETRSEAIEMVASGKYPSPPARVLYLVTREKPTGLTQAFIQWILEDGQEFVESGGYVKLTPEQLNSAREMVR